MDSASHQESNPFGAAAKNDNGNHLKWCHYEYPQLYYTTPTPPSRLNKNPTKIKKPTKQISQPVYVASESQYTHRIALQKVEDKSFFIRLIGLSQGLCDQLSEKWPKKGQKTPIFRLKEKVLDNFENVP